MDVAQRGFARAQLNVGVMYAHGETVPQDKARACAWYLLAAANGSETEKEQGELELTKDQLEEAQALFETLQEKFEVTGEIDP